MSIAVAVPPPVWGWYGLFIFSLGAALAFALAFAAGVVVIDWLLEKASRIGAEATPSTFIGAQANLLRMAAQAAAVVIVIVAMPGVYYAMFLGTWTAASWVGRLAPAGETAGTVWTGPDAEAIGALLPLIGVAALLMLAGTFAALHGRARRASREPAAGLGRRMLVRYFLRRWVAGLLVTLVFWPFVGFFLYDLALLTRLPVADGMTPFTLPESERIALRFGPVLASTLAWVVLIPAAWLLVRSIGLAWRYTAENPAMNLILRRTVKQWVAGGLCLAGGGAMAWWADVMLRLLLGERG